MWFKKVLQSLNTVNNESTTTASEEKKKKKIQNQLQNKSKYKKNKKCFSRISAVSFLALAMKGSSPLPPYDAFHYWAGLWSAVSTAQTLIWPYSCVFLPPMSIAARAMVFFVCVCEYSHCSFTYSIDTEPNYLIVCI